MVVKLFIKFKNKYNNMKKNYSFITASCFSLFLFTACNTAEQPNEAAEKENKPALTEAPEYFNLRPKLRTRVAGFVAMVNLYFLMALRGPLRVRALVRVR